MKKIIKHENGQIKIQTINTEPSMTSQQFKDQCDVNNIMKKYRLTGELTHLRKNQGQYIDLTQLPDYQTALQTVIDANSAFESLPAHVRKHFQNDPKQLLQFVADPKNKEEAIKLGLIPEPQQKPNVDIKQNPKQNKNDDKKIEALDS